MTGCVSWPGIPVWEEDGGFEGTASGLEASGLPVIAEGLFAVSSFEQAIGERKRSDAPRSVRE
jgi:hypothetical protein